MLSIHGHILGTFAGGCPNGQGIGVEIYDPAQNQNLILGLLERQSIQIKTVAIFDF